MEKDIPNNIKIQIPMKIRVLLICQSYKIYISPVNLDVAHIEVCDFYFA